MQRKTIPGHFTRIDGSTHIGISEEEARRLVVPDVERNIASMKASPFSKIQGENCQLMYEVHSSPVQTVENGGPLMRKVEVFGLPEIIEFMLDLVLAHRPTLYDHFCGQYEMIRPAVYDNFAATLMEVLDAAAGPDITFTARQQEIAGETITTLGFWPTEEPENGQASAARPETQD